LIAFGSIVNLFLIHHSSFLSTKFYALFTKSCERDKDYEDYDIVVQQKKNLFKILDKIRCKLTGVVALR
jgi:hypothetical protein